MAKNVVTLRELVMFQLNDHSYYLFRLFFLVSFFPTLFKTEVFRLIIKCFFLNIHSRYRAQKSFTSQCTFFAFNFIILSAFVVQQLSIYKTM